MKKFICLILILALTLIAFSGCKNSNSEQSSTELPPYYTSGWESSYHPPVAEGYVSTTMPIYNDNTGYWECDRYQIPLSGDEWKAELVPLDAGGGYTLYNESHDVSIGVNIFDENIDPEVFKADYIKEGMMGDFEEYIEISTAQDVIIDGYNSVYVRAFVEEELQTWVLIFINTDEVTYKFTVAMPFDEVDLEKEVTNAILEGLKVVIPDQTTTSSQEQTTSQIDAN